MIPYVILQCDFDGSTQVFQYTRGKGQGEKRLHALRSVESADIFSREDAAGNDLYRSGMQREFRLKKLIIEAKYSEQLVGLRRFKPSRPSAPRGRTSIDTDKPSAKAREIDLPDSGFAPVTQLKAELDRFETWSQLCLVNLFR
ncbi:MAG: hypothetical protein U0930_23780 [Pirellulales bacterium]